MTLQRQLILFVARDVPGLRHQLAVLAHGQTGARFAVAWEFGDQVPWAQLQKGFQFVGRGLGAVGLQQNLAQAFIDADRRIGRGVDAASNAAIDLAQGNFVRHQQRRFQPGAACLLNVIGRGGRGQPRAEHAFARQVEIPRMLEHRPRRHFAHAQAMQVEAFDQAFERCREHRLVTGGGIWPVGAGERNPVTADNRDAAQLSHEKLLMKYSM